MGCGGDAIDGLAANCLGGKHHNSRNSFTKPGDYVKEKPEPGLVPELGSETPTKGDSYYVQGTN